MLESRQPTPNQENAWTPPMQTPFVFDGFNGLNTKPSRTAIEDQQMYICDGFIPIGPNNLRTLPGVGTSIFTAPTGTTITWFDFGNIGTAYVAMVVLSNGAIYQVNTATSVSTLVGPAGTIINPSASNLAMTQAGAKLIVLLAQQSNGLFLWDGNSLYQAGTIGPDATILNSGKYTSPPTLSLWGGTGTGAALTCSIFDGYATNISITSVGTGYSSGDFATIISSGGGTTNRSAKLTAYVSNGSVTSIGINDAGLGYTTTASLAFIGGSGSGAAGYVTVAGTSISAVAVSYPGSYLTAPTPYVVDPYNSIVQGTVDTMPYGVQGNGIETYVGRLWITNGGSFSFSAALSLVNFASSSGGGTAQSTDSFLRNAFSGAKQSNGFLYLIGDSSINTISGVQQSGTPPVTTYNNQNADPEVGSGWPHTISTLNRSIVLANGQGVYVCSGGTVVKISDQLDGIYTSALNPPAFTPSAAKATVYGIRCWCMLMPMVDQVTGNTVNKIIMTDGKKWWTTNQDVSLTYIATQTQSSVFTAFGTDGTYLYPLFNKPSTGFTKTVQSKLNYFETYALSKVATRLWGIVNYYNTLSPTLSISIDSELGSNPTTYTISPLSATWLNNANVPATWYTNSSAVATWLLTSNGVVVFPPIAVGQQGVALGMTISTQAADMALVSASLGWEHWGYRG